MTAESLAPEFHRVRTHYSRAHHRGRAFAELCRLQISRVPILVMVATAVAADSGAGQIALSTLLIATSCAFGATLNDLADVDSDRSNDRIERPLVNGTLTRADAGRLAAVLAAVVVVTQFVLPQPTTLLVSIAATVLAWASACRPLVLQERGLLGLVALGFAYFVLPVALVLGTEGIRAGAPIALLAAGVLAHKDVRDEHGDRLSGKRTLLVRVGYKKMSWIALATGVAGIIGCCIVQTPSWWLVPAVLSATSLAVLVTGGHHRGVWLASRTALVTTGVLIGVGAAASTL